MTDHEYLFLVGIGRSGTTALTQVMNGHQSIVVGVERFKRLWTPGGELTPELFERDRFFDFSDDLTNVTPQAADVWARMYEQMAAKFDTARYVGDKITRLPAAARLEDSLGPVRMIVIVREIWATAYSWQTRADNPKDVNWAAARDAKHAVQEWNAALKAIRAMQLARPDRVLVIEYDSFFRSKDQLHRVLAFLDLEMDAGISAAWDEANSTFTAKLENKDRTLPPQIQAYVEREARWGRWEAVTAQVAGSASKRGRLSARALPARLAESGERAREAIQAATRPVRAAGAARLNPLALRRATALARRAARGARPARQDAEAFEMLRAAVLSGLVNDARRGRIDDRVRHELDRLVRAYSGDR